MPRIAKPLTDTQVRNAKVENKEYNLSDGAGLYLRIKTNGSKSTLNNGISIQLQAEVLLHLSESIGKHQKHQLMKTVGITGVISSIETSYLTNQTICPQLVMCESPLPLSFFLNTIRVGSNQSTVHLRDEIFILLEIVTLRSFYDQTSAYNSVVAMR